MESYQSDICRFRAMTLSPLDLVVNKPVFTINYIYRYTPCPEKNGTTLFLRITLPNAGQFSKIFHQQT